MDQLEEIVTSLTVRWDNVNSQVTDRLRIAEEAQQTQMVYRSQYDEEVHFGENITLKSQILISSNGLTVSRQPSTVCADPKSCVRKSFKAN